MNETVRLACPACEDPTPPELSLLVPAMDEERTIGEFVDWCREGLADAKVSGEVVIVDSSSDQTAAIALAHGARVVYAPKRGLGRAYIDAIPFVRGAYVVMGDADLTYDFRELKGFLEAMRDGAEFVMGSRFKGSVQPGAMPGLHRYFGNPATTWLLNLIYGTRFSDIHCGMRGVTLEALKRMHLRSQSWQYASEMIIKATHLRLRTAEVPVHFYKDREYRQSHLKRIGWTAPWLAGWLTVKALLMHAADVFLFKPGIVMSALAGAGIMALSAGPRQVFGLGLSLHWMLLFLVLFVGGLNFTLTGVLAKILYDEHGTYTGRWRRYFDLDRVLPCCALMLTAGFLAGLPLVLAYVREGYRLPPVLGVESYEAVAGLALGLAAFTYFTASLVIQAALSRLNGGD